MTRGPDTRGCMLDRAGGGIGQSSELFRFSTTALQWEQLDAALVSGSPPSARDGHTMAAVGSDIVVFGGYTDQGEEPRCACWPPSGVMSEIAAAIGPRTTAVRARPHGLERGCCAWRHPGLVVKHGAAQQFYTGTVCRSGHTLMTMCTMCHREPRGAPGVLCRG